MIGSKTINEPSSYYAKSHSMSLYSSQNNLINQSHAKHAMEGVLGALVSSAVISEVFLRGHH